MTNSEFTDYRLSVMHFYGLKCDKMIKEMQIGSNYFNTFYNLVLAKGLIKILMEYTLVSEGSTDRNFYTQDEMFDLSQKLNIIIDMNNKLNFYLT